MKNKGEDFHVTKQSKASLIKNKAKWEKKMGNTEKFKSGTDYILRVQCVFRKDKPLTFLVYGFLMGGGRNWTRAGVITREMVNHIDVLLVEPMRWWPPSTCGWPYTAYWLPAQLKVVGDSSFGFCSSLPTVLLAVEVDYLLTVSPDYYFSPLNLLMSHTLIMLTFVLTAAKYL